MSMLNWTDMTLHVKWFTDKEGMPMSIGDVVTGSFVFWLSVTLVGLLVSAVFNEPLQRIGFIDAIHKSLDKVKPYTTEILRIGLGIALLLQLVTNSFLAPELAGEQWWIRILLVIAGAALLMRRTLWVSGAAIGILYGYAVVEYGLFHALDYMFYIGIVYYLVTAYSRLHDSATPALYLFTGLSLLWVGLEKMTMPHLAVDIVEKFNVPTFGFPVEDFILITAFIEIGLAWTFIVGILNRFISIIVTLVFITTTTVFGFKEIVGHTIVHTLLIMFLVQGEGVFKTPFQFHNSPVLRYSFVLVNFIVLLFGSMWLYIQFGNM